MNFLRNYGKAVKGSVNASIGIDNLDAMRTKHDIHHGTNFWKHWASGDDEAAEKSLNNMINPTLKQNAKRIHKANKLLARHPITGQLAKVTAGAYFRGGKILGNITKAENMSEKINKEKAENINTTSEEKAHLKHFKDATEETKIKLQELLENKVLNEETRNTIRESLEIIAQGEQQRNNQNRKGGSSCSSRKHKKSRKSKKGKKSTRKSAKKTRKSHKKTKRGTKRKY